MADAHANFAISTVATAPSPAASGTSLIVTGGQGPRFPTAPFNATICPAGATPTPANAEIVRVTGLSTDTLTITRAQESTSARTVVVGDIIYASVTAKSFTDLEAIAVSGVNTGDQTSVSGNAGTATALQNARTIGGSSFDGTANVTSFPIPGAIGGTTPAAGAFTTLAASGQVTSTVSTGTAPLSIASTTRVSNLNVATAGNADTVTTNANLTGDVTSSGNATTLASGNAGNLNSGTLLAARMPALTGDVTTSAGAVATTIATAAVTPAKMSTAAKTSVVGIVIDGGGSAITTGVKGDIKVPFGCTITGAQLLADQSGSIVIDVWKDTLANYPPTGADSITASAKPTLSSATNSNDTTLTGWTTTITSGDCIRFNVDSATTVTRVTLELTVTRT